MILGKEKSICNTYCYHTNDFCTNKTTDFPFQTILCSMIFLISYSRTVTTDRKQPVFPQNHAFKMTFYDTKKRPDTVRHPVLYI